MTTRETTGPEAAGATLHLGGTAWCTPDLAPLLVPIEQLTPFPGNARRGDQDAITSSVRDLGVWRAHVVQQSTGHVMVGNHQLRALLDLGATHAPASYRDTTDDLARAIALRDNHTSDLGTYDDADLLALLRRAEETDTLALTGYADDDVATLLAALDGPPPVDPIGGYTRKADPIQYTPTWEQPPAPEELVDRAKAEALTSEILAAELPEDVTAFLLAGAQRHLNFNYALVAEFYAHASPEVQELMEASALVIIDFDDAIRHGYVRLSSRLRELLDLDQDERARLDAEKADDA